VKTIPAALLTLAVLAWPTAALGGTQIFALEDPTPTGSFSGDYYVSCQGSSPKHGAAGDGKNCEQGYQDGYVGVYDDGVVACNGSTDYAPYDQNGDGTNDPIQGYVWVGSGEQATGDKVFETPGGEAGAGSNHGKLSHEPTGEPPCPEADPEGDGPG
jgi:hypothetical protein